MKDRPYRVLFLSRRATARSVMAEGILNKIGGGRFVAESAAVEPGDAVEPDVVTMLAENGITANTTPARHVRDVFAAASVPFDFVITLSDTAAAQSPHEWPGVPITAHWSFTDPVLEGNTVEKHREFSRTYRELERRLAIFTNLPMGTLDRMSLQEQVEDLAGGKKSA